MNVHRPTTTHATSIPSRGHHNRLGEALLPENIEVPTDLGMQSAASQRGEDQKLEDQSLPLQSIASAHRGERATKLRMR